MNELFDLVDLLEGFPEFVTFINGKCYICAVDYTIRLTILSC